MNGAFISYTGDRIERGQVVKALREHGINPWRDVENLDVGDDTTDTILAELANCSGVILWINERIIQSAYVAKVELPAIARAARNKHLRIVPVFDGMTPQEGAALVSRMGVEIGDSHGHVVDPDADPPTTSAAIASRYVRGHLKDAHTAGASPVVRMVTYDDTASLRDRAVLNLDWRHHLTDGNLTANTEQRLRSALHAATGALKAAYGACQVTIAAKAHLSLAVALGHAFSQPTGCTLRLHREDGAWTTLAAPENPAPLNETRGGRGPVDAGRACVELSVTRNVDARVAAHISAGNRYRHRVILTPADGPGRTTVGSSEIANGWAQQIGDVLTRVADQSDVDHTDLFLATPIELAVMIGWWTNAAGRINLMDWAKTGPYRRLWELP
ncbi:MAG: SAVED domain-containing protein [Actinobacteria bacterium]|nr:SAVED domain-containing protein [Actinomycetota bacterium]